MALTKLLENTLDESSKLKNMSNERLGCLTKSLLSQNFYQTMSDFSETLILHPAVLFNGRSYQKKGAWNLVTSRSSGYKKRSQ